MADNSFRPPKPWVLIKENVTITDYANWQSNVLFHLSLCNDFAAYLAAEWSKQGVANRGFTDDAEGTDNRKLATQKVITLERMLGIVAQFAPSLLRNEIHSSSDYSSSNPRECQDESCQICSFVNKTASSVVSSITVNDVLSGSATMPYKNTSAWKSAQHECPDLRRTYAHLTQGTRPSRKSRNLKNLRRYLNVATVNDQGLIVMSKSDPYLGLRHLTVVPDTILHGLLTALHLCFKHASKSQLTQLFNRHFFGIKSAHAIKQVVKNCEQYNPMKVIPR